MPESARRADREPWILLDPPFETCKHEILIGANGVFAVSNSGDCQPPVSKWSWDCVLRRLIPIRLQIVLG